MLVKIYFSVHDKKEILEKSSKKPYLVGSKRTHKRWQIK
jgi:hypothetical protein